MYGNAINSLSHSPDFASDAPLIDKLSCFAQMSANRKLFLALYLAAKGNNKNIDFCVGHTVHDDIPSLI